MTVSLKSCVSSHTGNQQDSGEKDQVRNTGVLGGQNMAAFFIFHNISRGVVVEHVACDVEEVYCSA